MPFWPFLSTPKREAPVRPPDPEPRPADELQEIKKHVAGIETALRQLLERPPPAHPEVLAAHVRALASRPDVPAGLPGGPRLPGPGADSEPMFIPSQIVPDAASARIKVREGEVEKDDLEDGVAALRRARKGS